MVLAVLALRLVLSEEKIIALRQPYAQASLRCFVIWAVCIRALFRCKFFFWNLATVLLSFVCDN
jgi:hypothetical protein